MDARFPDRRRSGAVLLMVLAFIFLASVLTVALLETMTRHMRSAATALARDDLRLTAFSAMQVALATLSEIKELDGNLYSPAQGWGDPLGYAAVTFPGDTRVSVQIADETGKIPLRADDRDSLLRLFEHLGVGIGDSEELVDAFIDWTDEDDLERLNGAEKDYYERLDPPRRPPNQPITSFDDFRYIKGFDELFFDEQGTPNGLFFQFRNSVSLRHNHQPNVNTLSPTIRAMLAEDGGLNEFAFEDRQLGLDDEAGTADDGWLTSPNDLESVGLSETDKFGYQAKVFRITVTVEQGMKTYQLYGLVEDGIPDAPGGSNAENASDRGNADPERTLDDDNSAGGGAGAPTATVEMPTDGNQPGRGGRSNSGGGPSAASTEPIYQIGDWSFYELSENGSEDG